MLKNLSYLLNANPQAQQYFTALPKYVQEEAKKHEEEIDSVNALRLFAETFMNDDSYRGA